MREADYTAVGGGKCGYDAAKATVKIKSEINIKPMSDTDLEAALMKSPVLV